MGGTPAAGSPKKKGSGLGSGSNLASGCGVVCLGTTILIEVNHT